MPRKNLSRQILGALNAVASKQKTQSIKKNKKNSNKRRRKVVGQTRLAATQRQRVITRSGNKNMTIISGSEVVNSIPFYLTDAHDEAVFSLIPANPCYWKGTNIAQQAANYGAYRPLRWSYTYIPQVSVNYTGIVQAGTLWDAVVSRDALSQTLMTSPGGALSQVWSKFGRNVPLKGLQQKLYNCNGDLKQSTNPFFFVAYNRGATQLKDLEEYVIPGTFVIHYRYAFYNKLGASQIYGRINNVSWATDDIDRSHAHMSFVVRGGKAPPVTVLDIDNGELLNQGTKIDGSSLTGDVYWNDPSPNETTSIMLGGDLTLQYLTDIEYTNDPDGGWATVDTYYGPMSYELTYGLPGYITIMVAPTQLLGSSKEKYNCSITAWIGTRKIDKTAAGAFSGGVFCYIPFTSSTYVRGVSSLGKHSNWLYFNYTWTSALTITTEPPSWMMCPPWAGAKLEDHHQIIDEDDAPTEDDYPNGLPKLDEDIIPSVRKVYTPVTIQVLPQASKILSKGTYYALKGLGVVPFILKRFEVASDVLYDPATLPIDYYIVDNDNSTVDDTVVPTDDFYAIYSAFPYIIRSQNAFALTQLEYMVYLKNGQKPSSTVGYCLIPNSNGEIDVVLASEITDPVAGLNAVNLPESIQQCTIMAYTGKVWVNAIQISYTSTTNEDGTTTKKYVCNQLEFHALPKLSPFGFYHGNMLFTDPQNYYKD